MAKQTWLDKMIGRVRLADTDEDAHAIVKDYLDPATGERVDGADPDDGDTHVHIHLEKNGKEGDMANGRDEFEDPNDPGGNPDAPADPDEIAAAVAALTQRVAALEAALEGDEGEMELEDPDTKDVRRYSFRRGAKMKARDQDPDDENAPDRVPEIVGETDLPGIEDLDKRMANASSADKRRARDRALRTRDSADMEESWREMVALAEIIQPGVRVGTFDARLPMLRTAERQCAFRRRVVDAALKDEKLGGDIAAMIGVRSVDGLPCDSVKLAFTSIGNVMRTHNNDSFLRTAMPTQARGRDNAEPFKTPTPAEMNKLHKDFWKSGSANGSVRR